jgi:hypothetical protein
MLGETRHGTSRDPMRRIRKPPVGSSSLPVGSASMTQGAEMDRLQTGERIDERCGLAA